MELHDLDWAAEPDILELRRYYDLIQVNPEKAIVGLRTLAEQGSIAAMLYMADFQGRLCNQAETIYWYDFASKAGFGPAAYMLGRIFTEGGRVEDAKIAYERGLTLGYIPAAYRLAKIHIEADASFSAEAARSYLELGVRAGHIPSQRDLGFLLLKSRNSLMEMSRGFFLLLGLWLLIPRIVFSLFRKDDFLSERLRV